MEVLDRIGDSFNAVTGGLERFITRMFGSSNERRVREIGFLRDKEGNDHVVPGSVLDRIRQLEPEIQKLSDDELRQTASLMRKRLAEGETLDDLLPEMFARTRESAWRNVKMRHYDVQLVGGYFLHKGMIAEMVTGEGKTLVATLPAALNALAMHVHVITVNDYLALRDMEWMGPIYMGLGLTVGAIQSNMGTGDRKKAYSCDITYGTNNEFGFDYLRDNMKPAKELQVQGPLDFAIVDEIDNILIDEARTPLIISGPAHDDVTKYAKADKIARQLVRDKDFEVKEKEHTCHLTEEGVRHAEELAGVESFYTAGNMEWPHLIDNSLKAHYLYKRDVNYVVEGSQVVIVDEFTGRKMEGRQWSDGLHQAVEAKEGVKIKAENQTLATITLQNFFKLYKKLAGMTGTAMTEAAEFVKVYNLDVIAIPTNRPLKRINFPDMIYRTEKEKWDAVINEIREVHKTGRPILVGTTSIETSELLSSKLSKYGIKHNVLNAKYHEREAEIIAQAGRLGAVTIATNMAGRGTDIVLGGNPEHMAWEEFKHKYKSRLDVSKFEWDELTRKIAQREGMDQEGRKVADVGGLHVIGTERHDSRRIDLQLRGRSGRQGDPGSSRFYLSLDDKLMRLFAGEWVKNMLTRLGMQEGEAIESRMVSRRIEAAQKKREETHFDQRKHLLEYDEVMDDQRKRVYSYRQRILDGANCRDLVLEMMDQQIEQGTENFLDPNYRWDSIVAFAGQAYGIELERAQVKGMDADQLQELLRDEAQRQAEDLIREQMDENLPEDVEDQREWNWLALSRWVNTRYGLNTNDRELKKIGREELFDYLVQRINEAIGRVDFSPSAEFLADDFTRKQLCGWLHHQFTLECKPEEFEEKTPPEARELISRRLREMYREKEVTFPVAVGMTNFLDTRQPNREGLVRWANDRFGCELKIEEVERKSLSDLEQLLTERSRNYFVEMETLTAAEDILDGIYGGEGNGRAAHDGQAPHPESFEKLTEWAKDHLRVELRPEEFASLTRDEAWQRLLRAYDERYRPELAQAERMLLLEVLDQSWKDHLYYMDYLRSSIGLQGYAQKDPKVEYKREGRKAFKTMWERIGQQVTGAIFRLEKESAAFVGSLWQITSTVHEEVVPGADFSSPPPESNGRHDGAPHGQSDRVVEPIRNFDPKVGRNDPCPCGSGKKYKKCHGAAG